MVFLHKVALIATTLLCLSAVWLACARAQDSVDFLVQLVLKIDTARRTLVACFTTRLSNVR
jgi:hypothetical protein